MTNDPHIRDHQRLRTELGLRLLAASAIRFVPEGGGEWLAIEPGGARHLLSVHHCTCDDFALCGPSYGLRCRHMEALRISLSALGIAPGEPLPDLLIAAATASFPLESDL